MANKTKCKRTHKVIDTIYTDSEFNQVLVDTKNACDKFVDDQGGFGFKVLPLSEDELKLYNENYSNH